MSPSETYVRVTHVKVHARCPALFFFFYWELQAVGKVINYEIETCTHSKNLANSVRVRISSKHMASYKTTPQYIRQIFRPLYAMRFIQTHDHPLMSN